MTEWLAGLAVLVLTGLVPTWLLGWLNRFLPLPGRSLLAVRNLFTANLQCSDDRFRFVLCWLKNDSNGNDTAIVSQAFTSVQGVTLVRSARVAKAPGAADDWRPAMRRSASAVLECWDADLALVGLVKQPGEVLSLWFIPRAGQGTLGRGDRPYRLEDVTLGEDFHDDLHAQLTALALAAVAPLSKTETRGRVLEEGLTEVSEKLATLLEGYTFSKLDRRAALHVALGNRPFRPWASGNLARSDSNRRYGLTGRRWRNSPASACPSIGPRRRTESPRVHRRLIELSVAGSG